MTGGIETAKVAIAKVDWEANAPRSIFFSDIYFSGDGAAEARHVFIDGNDLERRLAGARRFVIGELGFGTGLNVLVAWDLWRRLKKPDGARLHVLSFEKYPLSRDDLARAHQAWPQFSDLGDTLLARYPPLVSGVHRLRLVDDVTLTLVFGDARDMLKRVEAKIDAWFLDGFAPSKNPDLWTAEIFAEVARLSAPGASAATFTVAGDVRRALAASGFSIEKREGFGRKKEMLTARLATSPPTSDRAPWFQSEKATPLATGARVAIIGGGVAGCSLAHELVAAGLEATIIDGNGLASGASGNPAGLIMPRLDLGGAAARFFRAAYFEALTTISALECEGARFFNPCGVLLKATTDDEGARQQKILAADLLPPGWIEAREGGLFFPQAGVIDPPRYCAALAIGAEILRSDAIALDVDDNGVSILFSDGSNRRFDAVVIANGRDALRFVEARTLPLAGVMGQIDYFPAAAAPAFGVAFGPYAAPAPAGGVVIGATYEPIAAGVKAAARVSATIENIGTMASALPAVAATLDPAVSSPRASVRCQTPDRLAVAGPMPDWDYYGASYDDLRLGKRRGYPRARSIPGVHVLTGLGSRGLVTAPILAAHVVAAMTGAPSPLERDIAEAIHPARFFIRDLKRSQRILTS